MAIVRALKFKLVVPRGRSGLKLRQALWTTHATVNEAVAYYEQQLLVMRGQAYLQADDVRVSQDVVTAERDQQLAAARQQNGQTDPLDTAQRGQAGQLLTQVYAAIVPSHIGEKGTAQSAKGFLDGLTGRASRFGMSIFEKIGTPPAWVDGVRRDEAAAFEAAQAWLQSEAGLARQKMTGSPPGWLRRARAGDDTWPRVFVDDLDKKLKEAAGYPTALKRLRELGVLPLFQPYIAPRLEGNTGTLTPWDRLAWRLAVEHLLSWESWGRKAAQEHAQRRHRIDTFRQRYVTAENAALLDQVRTYEQARQHELNKLGQTMARGFRITLRMVRSWPELRERWLRHEMPTPAVLQEDIATLQTRLRGRFGDPHLFRWLARPEQYPLWQDTRADVVSLASRLNAMQAILDRSRDSATLTLAEPRDHPRLAEWGAPGDSNLRNYRLQQDEQGGLTVTLPLLQDGDNGLQEVPHALRLAPSGQCYHPILTQQEKKRYTLRYTSSAGEQQCGDWGAVNLLLDWGKLRNRSWERIKYGDIGPVYLKAALTIAPHYPPDWGAERPASVNYFMSARGNDKYLAAVQPPLRVLSVDLGLRHFATCSVFELATEVPAGKWGLLLENGLWAWHERSFTLSLPNETADHRGEQWRRQQMDELGQLRRTLTRYRRLYSLAEASPGERLTMLAEWQAALVELENETWPFEAALLARLQAHTKAAPAVWGGELQATLLEFRRQFGPIVSAWRRRTRQKSTAAQLGKSVWAIDYLTSVRRFLQSWSLLGQRSGDIRRLDQQLRGIFARHLLDHINAIKEDRLKTGADLIVQAARGYQRSTIGTWLHRHAPCHIVLFEDLSRYRMRTDRPRRENSLLMKWAHRSIPTEVAMQGALYGIHTCDTGAAFSSRFHARTNAPGIRCHALRRQDLETPRFMEQLAVDNPGLTIAHLRPGDFVPYAGGTWFVCLGDAGQALRIHADINAAQNLQRRFWSRHGSAFRLPCIRVTDSQGNTQWVPRSLGKRALGALGTHGCLVPTGHTSESCRWEPLTRRRWAQLVGTDAAIDDDSQVDELADIAGLEDDALERSGDVTVFFRDPSGHVLPASLWFPAKHFWSVVRSRTLKALSCD